jgi:hypothetical protein
MVPAPEGEELEETTNPKSGSGVRGRPAPSGPREDVEDRPRRPSDETPGMSGSRRSPERQSDRGSPAGRGRDDRDDRDDDFDDGSRSRPGRGDDADRGIRREGRGVNVLGIISICLGIVSAAFALIPCIGFFSIPFSILTAILGVSGLIVAAANGKWGFITPSLGTVIGLGAIALPFLSCAGAGWLSSLGFRKAVQKAEEEMRKAEEEMKEADKNWNEGKKSEAVEHYKEHYKDLWTDPTTQNQKLRRIVEFELEQGNEADARDWIQKGVDEHRDPNYTVQKAKDIHAELWAKKWGGVVPGSSSKSSSSSSVSAQPDIDMTLEKYLQELALRDQSDKIYHDRTIKLTAKVSWYGRELPAQGGKSFFLLDGTQEKFLCPEDKLPSKALPGQQIVLRGKWTHSIFGVESWTFVSASGEGPPKISADQLAKDLAADTEATKQKWGDKLMVVNGEITDLPAGGFLLTPPGKDPKVLCWFYGHVLEQPKGKPKITLRKGQKITVVGKYEALGGQIGLCEIVELSP